MVDNRNPYLLSISKADRSVEEPSFNEDVILETSSIHCHWICNVPTNIKAVVSKIVSYMHNPEVNGGVSILEKCIIFDQKSCSKIDELKTVVTNFACVVPINLKKEDGGFEFEIDEVHLGNYTRDKVFAIKVTGHGQIHKLLSKCIEQAKQMDSDNEVNLLSSCRMETTFLKSVLHKSINKIQQDPALKTVEGRLVHLNIKDRAGYVVLVVEFGEGSDELRTHEISLIPSVRVTPCQHLFSYHRPKINQALKKLLEAREKSDKLLEIQIPNVPAANRTQHFERMWTLSCLERHSSCPEGDVFSTKFVLTLENLNSPAKAKNRLQVRPGGRSLSAREAELCESVTSPASRLLLEYYYCFGHIPEDEMQAACNFVMKIIHNLEKSIKADLTDGDPIVKEFFRTGSTAEGLKVCSPNEFDIMIRVDISKTDSSSYSVICQSDFPQGYAICKVNSTEHFSPKLSKCVIENRLFGQLLSPEKLVFSWFQGLVQRAINKENSENPSVRLKLRRKGPALMLEIQSSVPGIPENIDVDLVLAIETTNEKVPRLVVAKASSLEAYYKTKLQKENPGTKEHLHLQDEDLKCFWRISYSIQEKLYLEIIKEQRIEKGFSEGCQMACLKILKTIREREVLKKNDSVMSQKLNTYFLKTCLYHVLASKSSPEDWSYECLAERYLDVFNFFLDCLDNDILPHFFYESRYDLGKVFPGMIWNVSESRVNLLDELHSTLRDQIYARMTQIRDSFERTKRRIEVKVKECSENSQPPEKAQCLKNVEGYLNSRPFLSRDSHCFERNVQDFSASGNPDPNSTKCEFTGRFFQRILPDLLQNCSLEELVHPDFEATPWCKRLSSDNNRVAEIARKMVKETRKHGINDFEELKTKCTEEVERIHERDEDSDDEYFDWYD